MLNHQDADASTQYTVQSGDSLWSIAQKYGTTVDALKQSNQLQNNMVFPWPSLIYRGGSGAQSSATVPQQTGGTYTVQAGESLNVIATKYGVSVQDLMRANGLTNYLIHPNQQLQIPGGNGGNTAPKQVVLAVQVVSQQAVNTIHLHLTIKTYTTGVNVRIMYLIVVHKSVNLLVRIGGTLIIGQLMPQQMVIQ